MRATIDQAGRLVIPKALRDELGLQPGDVELSADGAALRVEVVPGQSLRQKGERLVIPAASAPVTAAEVQSLRDADQR